MNSDSSDIIDSMAFQYSTLVMLDVLYAANVAKYLRDELQKSSILEAVLVFPDLDIFKINDIEGLAELEIDGPYDFCIDAMVKDTDELLSSGSRYSYHKELDTIFDICWGRDCFPHINIFSESECRKAGGLMNAGYSTHSQRKYEMFKREMLESY